jgi:hypothetical protein
MLSSRAVLGLAALYCWAFTLIASLRAGEARVVEAGGPDRIVVETRDASVDEVLAVLAAHFEFTLERSAGAGQAIRFSGLLHGSLDQLLERVLRHEEHIVVRSAEARAGVTRVILLKGNGTTLPPAVQRNLALSQLSAGFPSKAKLLLPELWSGMD